ncbi:MAG: hypothetical protein R6V16_07795, partial [Bacteroidales bacterium]
MAVKKISIAGIGIFIIILLSVFKPTESSIISRNANIYTIGVDQNIIYTDIEKEYGITIDSFRVTQGKIKRNYNLARLLTETELEYNKINKAIRSAADTFDIRKIKAGNQYRLYYTKDSTNTLKYFVYQHSPIEYLKIDFNNEPIATRGTKEIVSVKKNCSGVISSSLWSTMIDNNIDPMMAIHLSEIYAWTVDFFGLEEGDQFKVFYDEQYVDSIPIGIGKIHAV